MKFTTLPVLLAAVLWGTTGTVSTMAPHDAPPAAVGSAGLALGGALLFLTSRRDRAGGTFRSRERWLLALGGLAVAGYPLTFYPAVASGGVVVATVIAIGSAPAFAGLLGWCTGQGRPSRRWAGATLAATAGCVLLVAGPALAGHGSHAPMAGSHAGSAVAGIGLAAAAGLSYAVYALIGGRLIARGHSSGQVMGRMFGVGSLLVLPGLASGGAHWLATVRGAAVALHLAVFTTFVAYRLFGRGLRGTSAQVATTLTLAEPAVATVLGVALLGERLPAVSWAGMAVLAAGLAVLTVPARTGVVRWSLRGSSSAPSRDCAPPACTRSSTKPAVTPRTCAAPGPPGMTDCPATRACR